MFSRIISAVHPRMRGERHLVTRMDPCQDGSSPHVRGTPTAPEAETLRSRFIPACAGNAHPLRACIRCQSVHPRMREERTRGRPISEERIGSSPHTRGTRRPRVRSHKTRRFIPACAGNAAGADPRTGPASVHPRMRGERVRWAAAPSSISGSSPHVRGMPACRFNNIDPDRFIPACAGNASRISATCSATPVHPRMCGERIRWYQPKSGKHGSSPHARGTRQADHLNRIVQRFIPAYAGNATTLHRPHFWNSVHPRIRGERKTSDLCKQHPDGSSPHTRGTLRGGDRMRGHTRFIPAYAGNAQSPGRTIEGLPVHPRIRRERIVASARNLKPNGSSPHTRGTPRQPAARGRETRFIPAYAGNATRSSLSPLNISVHPRIRGERPSTSSLGSRNAGSSPHARGTLGENKGDPVEIRFIPACAGNAREQCRRGRLRSVHPRMRGERALTIGGAVLAAGSSPHARGTRLRRDRAALVARFIPACAGNARLTGSEARRTAVHPRMRGERVRCLKPCSTGIGSSPHARGTPTGGSGRGV